MTSPSWMDEAERKWKRREAGLPEKGPEGGSCLGCLILIGVALALLAIFIFVIWSYMKFGPPSHAYH
jgi:hypothetical protein